MYMKAFGGPLTPNERRGLLELQQKISAMPDSDSSEEPDDWLTLYINPGTLIYHLGHPTYIHIHKFIMAGYVHGYSGILLSYYIKIITIIILMNLL